MNDTSGLLLRDFLPSAEPAPPSALTGASVVMVVYRTGRVLRDSVAAVLARPEVDELVIVDNGSFPEEQEIIDSAAARDTRITVIRGQGNVGFARAANMGAAAAHGRLLVVLNPDAFLEPGAIEALSCALETRAAPALVGARILNADGTEQRGARRGEVTLVTSLLSLTHLSRWFRRLRGFEIHREDAPTPTAALEVPTISGACFAMRRADFLALGGFDPGYFLHVEDVDLCWRVRRAGGAVVFEPEARVVHLGSTSRKSPLKVEFWKGLGLVRFFLKSADSAVERALVLLISPLIIAVAVLRPVLRGQTFKARGGLRF